VYTRRRIRIRRRRTPASSPNRRCANAQPRSLARTFPQPFPELEHIHAHFLKGLVDVDEYTRWLMSGCGLKAKSTTRRSSKSKQNRYYSLSLLGRGYVDSDDFDPAGNVPEVTEYWVRRVNFFIPRSCPPRAEIRIRQGDHRQHGHLWDHEGV
jgi:hypothetical protein